MNHRLIYVVGPSGAGKDSVLAWLRMHKPDSIPVHWTRRTINRPTADSPNSEQHEVVDDVMFEKLVRSDAFLMHWIANSHRYGIRKSELSNLVDPKCCVFVNGSRAHLSTAATLFPELTVLHITADQDVLRERLRLRGRESEEAIEARLRRDIHLSVPSGCGLIQIHNNSSLDMAGHQLVAELTKLGLWPKS
jgi:ribose 1,5-bisphosphokinase